MIRFPAMHDAEHGRSRAGALLSVLFLAASLAGCGRPAETASNRSAVSPDTSTASGDAHGAALVPFQAGDAAHDPWGYRTAGGRVVVPARFAFAGPIREGRGRVWLEVTPADGERPAERAWGYVDAEGTLVIDPRFDAAGDFAAGRAPVLAGEEYLLIDTTGAVVAALLPPGAEPPPAPSDSVSSLADYIAELGALAPAYALDAMPIVGESVRRLEVRPLRHGTLAVRERGWEGGSLVLVAPGLDTDVAAGFIAHFLRGRPAREVEDMFREGRTWQVEDPDGAGEFYRVRPRRGGGVEIHHVIWAS